MRPEARKDATGADIIEVGDQFYIRAQSSLADDRTRVLLYGDTFAVFNRYGDIQALGYGQQGIFHKETRYLSNLEIHIGGVRPLLLSSTVRVDNVLLAVDLTNPDMVVAPDVPLLRGTLHIYRTKFLVEGTCFDRFAIQNFGQVPVDAKIALRFASDFADIFEVRGQRRLRRGVRLPPEIRRSAVVLAYEGLDGLVRRTRIECSAPEVEFSGSDLSVPFHLPPREEMV